MLFYSSIDAVQKGKTGIFKFVQYLRLYISYNFFIYLLIDIQNLVFYYFNNAMMNIGGQKVIVISILVIFYAFSKLGYLVHMVELVLILWACHAISTVACIIPCCHQQYPKIQFLDTIPMLILSSHSKRFQGDGFLWCDCIYVSL